MYPQGFTCMENAPGIGRLLLRTKNEYGESPLQSTVERAKILRTDRRPKQSFSHFIESRARDCKFLIMGESPAHICMYVLQELPSLF